MKPTIHPVKGTRDFYPEEMALRNYIYATVRKVSESFGYQEWDAPFLEPIDLYAAKSGEELVSQQSFVFPDRSGHTRSRCRIGGCGSHILEGNRTFFRAGTDPGQ